MTVGHRLRVGSAWRTLALTAALAMLFAMLPLSGAFAQVDYSNTTDLQGADNIATSIAWSQLAYDSATEAALGRDDVFADNLASGLIQGVFDAPLLLTPSDNLHDDVLAELERLGVETVHILGGEAAISADVEDAVVDAGFDIHRHAGETRIETAIDIAGAHAADATEAILSRAFGTAGGDETQAFADALAAGGWAAEDQVPILFTQTDVLTGNTADYLLNESSIETIRVVGGTQAVSDDVVSELEAMGFTVNRVSGPTRFDTAVEIAAARGFSDAGDAADGVILVEGQAADAWPDGFSAAGFAANPKPIVLSNGDSLPDATVTFLEGGDQTTHLYCGTKVSDDACAEAAELLGQSVSPSGVTLTTTSVERGGNIEGAFEGDLSEVDTIEVSGDCVEDGEVTTDADGNFTIPTTGDAEEGSCELTFTVTFNDGQTRTFTETVTITAPSTFTEAPELVSSSVVNTTSTQALVRYTFDEAVGPALTTTFFRLYGPETEANQFFTPSSVSRVSGNDAQVDAVFTRAQHDSATVAAVARGAVQDTDTGVQNIEGFAPLRAVSLAAGITNRPDLTAVAMVNDTTVDFTFDEAIDTGGVVVPGNLIVVVDTGQAYMANTATVTGTDSRTVRAVYTDLIGSANARRGVADAGAVRGVGDASTNVLHTEPIASGGTVSQSVNITAVTYDIPNSTITYQFDRLVESTTATAGDFLAYFRNGGTAAATSLNFISQSQVRASFGTGVLNELVAGTSVDTGAVNEVSPNQGRDNAYQEFGRASSFAAGTSAAPVLTGVSRTTQLDVQGNVESVDMTYTFDKRVDSTGATGNFLAYSDTGVQTSFGTLAGANCQVHTTTTVRCRITTANDRTAANAAVVGAVEHSAVQYPNSNLANFEASRGIS